jgi:hypothetical protein
MTIDLLSLILGMGLVLVIAFAIGGVVALVKVMRLERNSNNIDIGTQQQLDDIIKTVGAEIGEIDHKIQNLYRDMDSRFDKFYSKIIQETNPKQRILNMIKSGSSSDSTEDSHKE